MTITANDIAEALRRWALESRDELATLTRQVRELAHLVAAQWRSDSAFRSAVLKAVAHGLGTAALRGPRATVLWAASAAGHVLTLLARVLDGPFAPAPAR